MQVLEEQDFISETSIFGNNLHIIVNENYHGPEQIKNLFRHTYITVKRMEQIVPTLEDVFIYLLEKGKRPEDKKYYGQ